MKLDFITLDQLNKGDDNKAEEELGIRYICLVMPKPEGVPQLLTMSPGQAKQFQEIMSSTGVYWAYLFDEIGNIVRSFQQGD